MKLADRYNGKGKLKPSCKGYSICPPNSYFPASSFPALATLHACATGTPILYVWKQHTRTLSDADHQKTPRPDYSSSLNSSSASFLVATQTTPSLFRLQRESGSEHQTRFNNEAPDTFPVEFCFPEEPFLETTRARKWMDPSPCTWCAQKRAQRQLSLTTARNVCNVTL